MVIENKNRKEELLNEISTLLNNKRIDAEKFTSLYAEYLLVELDLPKVEINYKSNTNYFGAYVPYEKNIILNPDKTKNLFQLLNTLAHELNHYKNDISKLAIKRIEGKESGLPVEAIDSNAYALITGGLEEEIDIWALDRTSNNEVRAREFALNTANKFLLELKEINKNGVFKHTEKIIKYLELKNKKQKIKEEKIYNNAIIEAKRSYNNAKHIIPILIKHMYNQILYNGQNFSSEFYKKNKTVAPLLSAYLSIYSSPEILDYIIEKSKELRDKDALKECLNNKNTNLNKEQILTIISLLNKNKKISYEDINANMPAYSEENKNQILSEYNKKISVHERELNN